MKTAISTVLLAASLASLTGCESGLEAQAGVISQQLDPAHNRAWTLTLEGVVVRGRPGSPSNRVALPDWIWADPSYACPPGLAIGPRGEAVITSNVTPTVWRVHTETLTVTVHHVRLPDGEQREVGFSAIAYVPELNAYVAASDVQGSVWRIERDLTRATQLAQREGGRPASCGRLFSRASFPGE